MCVHIFLCWEGSNFFRQKHCCSLLTGSAHESGEAPVVFQICPSSIVPSRTSFSGCLCFRGARRSVMILRCVFLPREIARALFERQAAFGHVLGIFLYVFVCVLDLNFELWAPAVFFLWQRGPTRSHIYAGRRRQPTNSAANRVTKSISCLMP